VALEATLVGRSYPPADPYEVTRIKIREFADAIGAPDDEYRDPDAARALGYPDVIAPPTFPIVVSMAANRFLIDDPVLGLDYARVVHGDQRFQYARPVQAGDVLVCATVIEDIMSRGGHDFLTTRTEVTTVERDPVVTVWTKLVVRGAE
jgi:acyl dehydratase